MDTLKRQRHHLTLNALKIEVSGEQKSAFSFHITQPVQACENGLAFHTENSAPPTACILDLGCTRVMGSRRAVEAFCKVGPHLPQHGHGDRKTGECILLKEKITQDDFALYSFLLAHSFLRKMVYTLAGRG